MAYRNGRTGGRKAPGTRSFSREFGSFEGQGGPKKSRRRRPGARKRKGKGGRNTADYQRGFRAALAAAGYLQPPDDSYEGNPGYPGEDHQRGDPELRGRARRIGIRY